MPALTPAEERQLLDVVRSMSISQWDIVKASLDAFIRWLESALYNIFVKIGNAISDIWNWIRRR